MAAYRPFAQASVLALLMAGSLGAAAFAQTPSAVANPELWPKAASPSAITDARTEAFITDLMSRMSLEEKVGQTIQGDGGSITPDDLRKYPLGSVLVGGNSAPDGNDRATPQRWVEWTRDFRAAALEKRADRQSIPIIFGVDAVHGHNNVVGATLFPHNIGLGAARDPDLIRRIGEVTALEMAAAGTRKVIFPTRMNLQLLAESTSPTDAIARSLQRPLITVEPWVEGQGLRIQPDAGYGDVIEPLSAL
ncbi:MAG: hypothetical protein B7Y78_01445 [Caulobacter sp. 35-67-4]|nr:MAG: hypothetical protein B7Y78_01445 [Caulobacter sp. 35-67-4]